MNAVDHTQAAVGQPQPDLLVQHACALDATVVRVLHVQPGSAWSKYE